MAFIESPRFFDGASLGSSYGPEYSSSITRTINGKEYRKARRGVPAMFFSIGLGAARRDVLDEVRRAHHAALGRVNSFRVKDYSDWSSADSMEDAVTDTDQIIGTGDTVEVDFQLVKLYTFGTESLSRPIRKPVSGTVVIALDGVPQPSGWTVDTTTGVVTFSGAPGGSVVVTAGFEYDVPVRFDNDQLQIQKIDMNYEIGTVGLIEDLREGVA